MSAVLEQAPAPIFIADEDYDRRKYIGSSNVAAIMGHGPQYDGVTQTAYGVYLAKTSPVREEMEPERRKFLDRRKRWEPVVVQHVREEFDAEIIAVNRRYRDPLVEYFAAEIDWEWRDDDGSIQNGETKTVHTMAFNERHGWGEPGTDEIPMHYYLQVQFGLAVTGRQRTAVAAFIGLDNVIFYRVERDEEDIALMRAECQRFWTEHVLAGVAPDPQTLPDLHKMFRKSNGLVLPATDELASKAFRLRAIISQIEALDLEREALEFDVKWALKDHDELFVDGRKLLTWKEQNWARLDQESLKVRYPKIHREMMLSGRHRVFKALRST